MNTRIMGWRKWHNSVPNLLFRNRKNDCFVGIKYCLGVVKFKDIGNEKDLVVDRIFNHRICFKDFKSKNHSKLVNNSLIRHPEDPNISFMGYIENSSTKKELSVNEIDDLLYEIEEKGVSVLKNDNYKYSLVINIGDSSYIGVKGVDLYATEDLNVFSSCKFKNSSLLDDGVYLFSDSSNV